MSDFIIPGLQFLWNAGTDIFNLFSQQSNIEQQRYREDTAIQRRVADMKAAGINPVLAAGQPASSAAMPAPRFEGKSDISDSVATAVKLLQMNQLHAGIAQTEAQTSLIKSQKNKADIESEWMENLNPLKQRQLELSNRFDAESIVSRVKQEANNVTLQEKEITLRQLNAELKQKDLNWYDIQAVQDVMDKMTAGALKHKEMDNIDVEIAKKRALIELYQSQSGLNNQRLKQNAWRFGYDPMYGPKE